MGREVTGALVEGIARGDRGAKLRSQVLAWHPGASRDQVDEAFQEACLLAEGRCRGQSEGEVFTWLRTTTHHELGRIRQRAWRRARRELVVDVSTTALDALAASTVGPEERLIEVEDQVEVERVTGSVLARLSERQREIVALHGRGRKRPEIAEHLGMTPRSVKRALERIMAVGRDELVRLAGHGCESGETVVARLAFGLARPREVRQAQLHLATCPRCGAMYEQLDLWREKVAALLPVPALQQRHHGVIEHAVHILGDALSGIRHQASGRAGALRQQVAEGTTQIKQHASATYYRSVDPTPLAGMRPGAAAAAVAGCLAIGGGATYCVKQSVDPIDGLTAIVAPAHHEKQRHREHRTRARVAQAPAPTVPTTTVQAPSTTAQQPAAQQPAAQPTMQATTPSTPPPSQQDEYEPVTGRDAATASGPSGSAPSTPAPAPAGGPGEFDGP
jgi:RNA polymerase sigma factor (sigma-70 family)